MSRQQLLAALPRKVDYAQWIDPDCPPATALHFRALLDTFNASLLLYAHNGRFSTLQEHVEGDPSFHAKYAIEGAGMAYGLLRRHGDATAASLESPYFRRPDVEGLFSLGVGMSLSFLQLPLGACPDYAQRLSLRGLQDGYGFYAGVMARQAPAPHAGAEPSPEWARACCGYGRSLWFVHSSRPDRLAAVVHNVPPGGQGPVWRGIGVAVAFTGGVEREVLLRLRTESAQHRSQLKRGIWQGLRLRGECHGGLAYARWAREVFVTPDPPVVHVEVSP